MQPTMKPIDDLSDDEFAHLAQRAARLPDAPAALVRAALDLWPQSRLASAPAPVPWATLAAPAQAALRAVAAVLSFDSWARPALAAGMRSGETDTRHLLFTARGRDIDLRISPSAGGFALSGQVLGPDETGTVELAAAREPGRAARPAARQAALDELGGFRLDGLEQGTVWLTLRMGGDEIVLPPIDLGAPPR